MEELATVTRQRRIRRGTAQRGTAQWSQAMKTAFQQAKRYAESLPEWPPFLIICDVGYCFDVYADAEPTGKAAAKKKKPAKAKAATKTPAKAEWPKKLPEQVAAVRQSLHEQKAPTTSEAIAKRFKAVKAEELLETLALIGQARLLPDGRYAI